MIDIETRIKEHIKMATELAVEADNIYETLDMLYDWGKKYITGYEYVERWIEEQETYYED